MNLLGPIKILEQDRHQLAFEPADPSMSPFKAGRLRFTPSGSRSRVEYAIETSSGGLIFGAWIALGLGLVALIAAPVVGFLLVVPSPDPSVRAQSVQVVQMVHFSGRRSSSRSSPGSGRGWSAPESSR